MMVVDEKHRHCTAVPPEELLGHLERQFQASKRLAAQALAERAQPPLDDRVYQLRSPNAVFEKARSMIRSAETVALFDGFPAVTRQLLGDLTAAAERGVRVGALVYKAIDTADTEGLEVVLAPRRQSTLERWPGQWLVLIVDAREMLLAFLSPDLSSVHQAIWSRSPYLVWVHQGGASSEMALGAIETLIAEGADLLEIRHVLQRMGQLKSHESQAYQHLRRSFELDSSSAAAPPQDLSDRDSRLKKV